ncbi:hypothetical protein Hte_005154 [Hypoxylon texense]
MSYPPAKRQLSNTSRESANGTPQTAPPSLRYSHIGQGLNLYPSPAYENGGYSLQPAARQTCQPPLSTEIKSFLFSRQNELTLAESHQMRSYTRNFTRDMKFRRLPAPTKFSMSNASLRSNA